MPLRRQAKRVGTPIVGTSFIKGERFIVGTLNGVQITNDVLNRLTDLPQPTPCPKCRADIYIGRMGAIDGDRAYEQVGFDPQVFRKAGAPAPPWSLDFHTCKEKS